MPQRPATVTFTAGLGFVLVAFAMNSIMTRFVVAGGHLDPGLTTSVRFLAGAVTLVVIAAATGRGADARPTRASLVPAFWLGAYAVLISYGYAFITAAAGTFVFYALVLATMVGFNVVAEGGRVNGRSLAGAVIALSGVGVLAFGRVEGSTPLGVLLLAGTGVSWGAYSLVGARSQEPLRFTTANFVVFGLVLVPATVLLFAQTAFPVTVTTTGLAVAVVMGAVTTALAYAVWYWSLRFLSRPQAATYQLAIPVIAAVLAALLLAETFTLRLALAGGLVVAGMALATPRREKVRNV